MTELKGGLEFMVGKTSGYLCFSLILALSITGCSQNSSNSPDSSLDNQTSETYSEARQNEKNVDLNYDSAVDLNTLPTGSKVNIRTNSGMLLELMSFQYGTTNERSSLTVGLFTNGGGVLDARHFILRANRLTDYEVKNCYTSTDFSCTQNIQRTNITGFTNDYQVLTNLSDLHLIYRDSNGEQLVGSLKGFLEEYQLSQYTASNASENLLSVTNPIEINNKSQLYKFDLGISRNELISEAGVSFTTDENNNLVYGSNIFVFDSNSDNLDKIFVRDENMSVADITINELTETLFQLLGQPEESAESIVDSSYDYWYTLNNHYLSFSVNQPGEPVTEIFYNGEKSY
jgi:hypothetical protein